MTRAAAAFDVAKLGMADARIVGGVRDVEGHGNIGAHAERRGDGAAGADLLLAPCMRR